jgi:hypothetical protein
VTASHPFPDLTAIATFAHERPLAGTVPFATLHAMMFALILLAGSASSGTAALQGELDQLVKRCQASQVASLMAREGHQVEITPLSGPDMSAAQKQQLKCVLDGLRSMPDLSFGFIGNEQETEGG